MRTTKELIAQLHEMAAGAFIAGIVVGFEKKTEFIWANSANPLGDLNALVTSGGKPIAIYRVDKSEGALTCSIEALEEYLAKAGCGVTSILSEQAS